MTIIYSQIIFFIVFVIIHTSAAFAQTGGDYTSPPSHVVATVRNGHPYYAGMTKDELYRIYPASSQQSYYKQGNEEWILFDDILTKDDDKDIIVFYLKSGLVSGWTRKELPKTPAEIFQTIVQRRNKFGGADLSGGQGGAGPEKGRRPIYQPPRINTNYY